jgi:nitrite reductase/ring-hydroxylating ferredoxin subunit
LTDWIKVADQSKLHEGGSLPVYPRGVGLLLVKVDGSPYAIANRCAHMACSLEAGSLDAFVLTCPCHDWRFDVRSGVFTDAPEISIATYPVRIDGGDVLVDLEGGAA